MSSSSICADLDFHIGTESCNADMQKNADIASLLITVKCLQHPGLVFMPD